MRHRAFEPAKWKKRLCASGLFENRKSMENLNASREDTANNREKVGASGTKLAGPLFERLRNCRAMGTGVARAASALRPKPPLSPYDPCIGEHRGYQLQDIRVRMEIRHDGLPDSREIEHEVIGLPVPARVYRSPQSSCQLARSPEDPRSGCPPVYRLRELG